MKDVTIIYQGGSGGFALYYYLLLSGKYQFDIASVKHMIGQQFPNSLSLDRSDWKLTEFWPDNVKLKNKPGCKVLLICNPLFNPGMYNINKKVSNDTYKILLYTNIHLQLRMAYDKQAYWFTPVSRQQFDAPADTNQYIRHILNTGKKYHGDLVDPVFLNLIEEFSPNQLVRLEDFVSSATINNFMPPNQDQHDFLKYWLFLQSSRAQQLITHHRLLIN